MSRRTPETLVAQFRSLHEQGHGVREIARITGAAHVTVAAWLTKAGADIARTDTWSDAEVELMAALWKDGKSASQVAVLLRAKGFPPRSRSAIIGKIHRLKLARPKPTALERSLSSRINRHAINPRKPRPAGPLVERTNNGVPVPLVPPEPIGGHGAPLLDLARHQCRWPTGNDGTQHLFCGATRAPGSSYCAAHAAMARAVVQPDAPKRRDAFVPSWRAA